MPRIINFNELQVCDIVLTTSSAPQSKAIRFGINSDISHAMICVSHTSVIDSTSEGVQARNVQKIFYDDSCSVYIMRSKKVLSDDEKTKITDYVRSVIGTPYSLKEAFQSWIKPNSNSSDLQFCSRLAARAYANIGIDISENPDFCTPAQIKKSPHFMEVPNSFVTITVKEKKNIESHGTTLDDMRTITNNLLKMAKDASPESKINDLNDITAALLKNPALDEKFANAYISSGYTYHWESEVRKYPWRYDIDKMYEFYMQNEEILPSLIAYCKQTLDDESKGVFKHWKFNYSESQKKSKVTNLKTFWLEEQLYKNLVFYHQMRVSTADIFLKNYQYLINHRV